ncbi:hypothetical protein BD770DRAFT_462786, partial [Pilaira anomala]
MDKLFQFYGFNTPQGKWLNYLGKQKAKNAAVNILLNEGKKYNKERGGKTKTANNKRRRKGIYSEEWVLPRTSLNKMLWLLETKRSNG